MAFIQALVLLFASFSPPAQSDITHGTWFNEAKTGQMQFFLKNEQLHGKITWIKQGNKKDERNPDPKLRERPLIGVVILTGFTSTDQVNWGGGRIYDPESGKTYSSKIKVVNDKEMEVRGFIGTPLLGRTTRFIRAN